jgi:hypothetical protein
MALKARKTAAAKEPAPAGAPATVSAHRVVQVVLVNAPSPGHPDLWTVRRPGHGGHVEEASFPFPGEEGARGIAEVVCEHTGPQTRCPECAAKALWALGDMVESYNWDAIRKALRTVPASFP